MVFQGKAADTAQRWLATLMLLRDHSLTLLIWLSAFFKTATLQALQASNTEHRNFSWGCRFHIASKGFVVRSRSLAGFFCVSCGEFVNP